MKVTKRIIVAIILCVSLAFTSSVGSYALTKTQINQKISKYQEQNRKLQTEINALKKEKNQQKAVLNALQGKIANIQAIINTYNAEIDSINSAIAENKKKIAQKEAEIEKDKLDYRKRIRAIYMSEWDSSLKILLDADSFSEYLQLQKLTEAISAKDKQLMNALSDEIAELDAINKENEELLQSQVEIKNEVKKQQDDLKSQQAEEKKIFDEIAKEEAAAAKQKAANENEIQNLKNQLETSAGNIVNAGSSFINTTTGFMWPVPGAYIITSGFRTAKRPTHNGMDISGGGVLGKPFVAITDGEVMQVFNSWTTASGRSGYASYGNYCTVDHGIITISGVAAKYSAIYAHATSIAVSVKQKVKKGQVLGYVGSTGNSTGPHLHIGIWKNSVFTDPQPLLSSKK